MATANKGDVAKINYALRLEESNEVLATNDESVAKKAGIFNSAKKYEPLEVSIGSGQVVLGLEEALLGMKKGEKKEVVVPPDKAFGYRKEELKDVIPKSIFRNQGIDPRPGTVVQSDKGFATITKVNDDNVTVDLNHPLAGKNAIFEIEMLDLKKK